MYDVRVAAGGSGYNDAVVLTAPGTGQDWSGKAVVVSGAIVGVRVLNPGFGYTASPSTITVSGGGGSGASVQGYPTPVAGNDPACSAMIHSTKNSRVGKSSSTSSAQCYTNFINWFRIIKRKPS